MSAEEASKTTFVESSGSTIFAALKAHDYDTAKRMVCEGCDVNQRDENGATPLMHLILATNHVTNDPREGPLAMLMVSRGADITLQDNNGDTLLHHATRGTQWVRFSWDLGCDENVLNKAGKRPKDQADAQARRIFANEKMLSKFRNIARRGDVEGAARWLLDHPDEKRPSVLNTVLDSASYYGHIELVNFLIAQGADDLVLGFTTAAAQGHQHVLAACYLSRNIDVNACCRQYKICAMTMAAETGQLHIIEFLVKHGADVNAQDLRSGMISATPLIAAAQHGHLEMVQYLLKHGANVHASKHAHQEVTAVHVAASCGHTAVVHALLEAGAIGIPTKLTKSKTPLCEAAQGGHNDTVRFLLAMYPKEYRTVEVKNDLVASFMDAARQDRHEVVEILLDEGVNPNEPLRNAMYALHYTAMRNCVTTAQLLIQRGVTVDCTTKKDPATPLMLAARHGHFPMVQLLLQHGADATYCLVTGETVVTEAITGGNEDILRVVLEAGGCIHHNPRSTRPVYDGALLEEKGPQEKGNALFVACYKGVSVDAVRLLLDRGARVNEFFNVAPLIAVAAVHLTCEALNLLFAHGAGRFLDVGGDLGFNALLSRSIQSADEDESTTSAHETARAIELILEHGANVNVRDRKNRTAVRYAALRKQVEALKHMLDFGADKNGVFDALEATSDSEGEDATKDELAIIIQDVVDYVPKPRQPKAVRMTVDGVPLFVMPWHPSLYRFAPRGFQIEMRALCLLRSRAECEPTWGCLPNEVFELVVAVAWREENIRRQLDVAH